jgi:hypothetical protein
MLERVLTACGKLLGFGRSPSPFEEDRRLWGRMPCDVETTCWSTATGADERVPARARNISRGGISLTVSRAFEPGELLSVSLPGGTESTGEVLACIVRCDQLASGWHLGCVFASELADDEVQRFTAGAPQTMPTDQRAAPRFPCQARAVFTPLREGEAQPSWEATVLNVSANGIALQAPQGLTVGDLLSIELRRGDGPPVLTTLASVVRMSVERDADQAPTRLAGCNFIHELSEEQLQLLL